MKYSKEYESLINDSSFPEEWKEAAIEYRRLKKLIKNVVNELSDMGLSPDVMQRLLQAESNKAQANSGGASISPATDLDESETEKDLEFEYELPDEESVADEDSVSPSQISPRRSRRVLSIHSPRRFRVRVRSEDDNVVDHAPVRDRPRPVQRLNVRQALMSTESFHSDDESLASTADESSEADSAPRQLHRSIRRAAAVKAEYVFAGPSDRPIPQFRLSLPSSRPPTRPGSPVEDLSISVDQGSSDKESSAATSSQPYTSSPGDTSDDSEGEDEEATPRALLHRDPGLPASPTLGKVGQVSSPIWAITSGADSDGFKGLHDDLGALSLGSSALDIDEQIDGQEVIDDISPSLSSANKEILITLPSDVEFFSLLSQALTGLSALHDTQQTMFKASVAKLCRLISQSISPESGVKPLRNVNAVVNKVKLKGKKDLVPATVLSYTKSDLYAWREIFTLWIEAQIFESSAERDRGERSVEEAEKRLKAFAAEVVKRGLGDRRTLSRKESRDAWAEFLRLNVLLLDIKRFQLANINAARKILKKHDKRTALTATTGFANFVRMALEADTSRSGCSSTWAAFNTSLPHILLASMTDTLLPILPSLEDYTCLICTSIAFKPIRLSCSHLFCVRCLAKMQRAGKAECPLCRAKTVLLADKSSLDTSLMNFMVEWFPLEVKEKKKSNEKEVAQQDLIDMGLDAKCTVM